MTEEKTFEGIWGIPDPDEELVKPKAPGAKCATCPLRRQPFVPPSGAFDASLIVIGEAPGETEVREGAPFVGPSGIFLDTAIEWAAGDPKDTFRTNIVCCKPIGRSPDMAAVGCCHDRLIKELEQCESNKILVLGMTATDALGFAPQQGVWQPWGDAHALVTWHPAYVLRDKPEEGSQFLACVASAVRGPEFMQKFNPQPIFCETLEALQEQLAKCPEGSWVALDTETDQIQWFETPKKLPDALIMLQLCWDVSYAIIMSDAMMYDVPDVVPVLKEFLAKRKVCAHNGKFDQVFLKSHIGLDFWLDFDTMLAHYILNENLKHGLKAIAQLEFGMADYEEQMLHKYLTSRNDRYSKIPFDEFAVYGAKDVAVTLALRKIYEERLRTDGQYDMPFMKIIMPAANMLTEVELRGMHIDPSRFGAISAEFKQRIDASTIKMRELGNAPSLNPNSTQQLAVLLYDVMKAPIPQGRQFKARSTNKDAIQKLQKMTHDARVLEFLQELKEYRRVAKMHNSYVDNLKDIIDINSRVHGTFQIFGTEVGRLSVRDPALQTIPRPDDRLGWLIRSMFTASPGNVLVIGDYSQAELRVLACYSNEPFLLQVYKDGRDLHTEVALKMFGPVFTKADRAKCKMFNFSYVYGGTEYSFAEDAGLPIEIASQFVKDYNRMMPTALAWKKHQFETLRKEGYVETVFGRRRRFPLIVDSILGDARKASTHMVISSTASDLDLIAALELHNEGIPIVLLVHDSIIAEVPIAQGRAVGLQMFAKMREVGTRFFPQIPWVADVEVRDRWCGGDYEAYDGPEEGWIFHEGEKENDIMADLSVHV